MTPCFYIACLPVGLGNSSFLTEYSLLRTAIASASLSSSVAAITTTGLFTRTDARVNNPVVVIAATDEDKDALAIAVQNKLYSVRKLELPRPTGRHAI